MNIILVSDSLAKSRSMTLSQTQVLLIAFGIMLFTRPGLFRKILGVFETPTTDLSEFRKFDADATDKSSPPQPTWHAAEPVRHAPPPVPVSFGRRK